MRHRREILDTYRRGDKLPNDELEFLRQTMQDIADAVSGFGDLFTLQYAYAQRVADDCRQFQKSRSERGSVRLNDGYDYKLGADGKAYKLPPGSI